MVLFKISYRDLDKGALIQIINLANQLEVTPERAVEMYLKRSSKEKLATHSPSPAEQGGTEASEG